MALAKIRKGDTIMVTAGRERGKSGKVLRVLPESDRVIVERVNMMKRHSKPRGPGSPSGIVEREASLHVSNLRILCDKCNRPVRTGTKSLEDKRRVRVCKSCGEQIDQ